VEVHVGKRNEDAARLPHRFPCPEHVHPLPEHHRCGRFEEARNGEHREGAHLPSRPAIQQETVMLMVCTSRSVSEVSLRIVILGFLEASQL